jgi:hypothetical protein
MMAQASLRTSMGNPDTPAVRPSRLMDSMESTTIMTITIIMRTMGTTDIMIITPITLT